MAEGAGCQRSCGNSGGGSMNLRASSTARHRTCETCAIGLNSRQNYCKGTTFQHKVKVRNRPQTDKDSQRRLLGSTRVSMASTPRKTAPVGKHDAMS